MLLGTIWMVDYQVSILVDGEKLRFSNREEMAASFKYIQKKNHNQPSDCYPK